MAQDRLSEGALLFPGMPTPVRDPPPGGYRIQRAIDAGGFGITYEAIKRDGGDPASDVTAHLWLPPYKAIVIKEFFPDFAARRGRTITVQGEDESHEETFNRALQRFQREAERLCYLTCLRALRAGRAALAGNSGVLGQRIDAEIEAAWAGNADPGRAMQLVGRLGGEARTAAQKALATSTLPIVYDFFASDDNAYYVMEFLAGGTLKARLNDDRRNSGTTRVEVAGSSYQLRKPWEPARLRLFAIAALDALEELHNGIPGQQLIHCDLKPGNIMFRSAESDDPVLIDFGLARNVSDGKSRSLIAGTSGFAPLEIDPHTRAQHDDDRFGGANVGPWTDIYSLAAILRMLGTGVEGSRLPAVFERLRTGPGELDPVDRLPPFPEGFPAALERGIRHGMALHMRDRPQSVAEWREELGLNAPVSPVAGETTGWGVRRSWALDDIPLPDADSVPAPPPAPPPSPPPRVAAPPLEIEPAEAETLVELSSAPTMAALPVEPAAPVIARSVGRESPQAIIGLGEGGGDGPQPPPRASAPESRKRIGGATIAALTGGVATLALVAAFLFGGGTGNDQAPAAENPALENIAIATTDAREESVVPKETPSPSPTPTPSPTEKPSPTPSPTPTPTPKPTPTPTPTPTETPGPRYQFANLGISTQALGQAQIELLLAGGAKPNDPLRITGTAGRVGGLGRGTILISACGGGSARSKLYELENGARSCFKTPSGNRWFEAPR